MQRYLIVVLIFNYLIIYNIEYPILCLLQSVYLLWWGILPGILHIFNQVVDFLLFNLWNSLYILSNSHLSDMPFANDFPIVCGFSSHDLGSAFGRVEDFNFDKLFLWSIIYLLDLAVELNLKTYQYTQNFACINTSLSGSWLKSLNLIGVILQTGLRPESLSQHPLTSLLGVYAEVPAFSHRPSPSWFSFPSCSFLPLVTYFLVHT